MLEQPSPHLTQAAQLYLCLVSTIGGIDINVRTDLVETQATLEAHIITTTRMTHPLLVVLHDLFPYIQCTLHQLNPVQQTTTELVEAGFLHENLTIIQAALADRKIHAYNQAITLRKNQLHRIITDIYNSDAGTLAKGTYPFLPENPDLFLAKYSNHSHRPLPKSLST